MELKDRIKSLRQQCRLTQAQLAEKAEVDQSTVSYWEKGRQEPNKEQRKGLCRALGVDLSELFKGVDL